MLPPFELILFRPLRGGGSSRDYEALAAGFVVDLSLLMNRLGDVHVRALADEEATQGTLEIVGELIVFTDGMRVAVDLKDGDEVLWSENVELADQLVSDVRLVLAANLIQAATGQRKDVRRARLGGTQDVEAYKRVCLARFQALPAGQRRRVLEEAVARDPDYAEAQLLLSDALEQAGEREVARELLAAVAKRFPRFSWARQRYGVSLRVAGFGEAAVGEVQAALDTDPDGVTLFHAGLFAEAGGDPRTAATLYQRAVERGCTDPVLCDKLARLRANTGDPKQAILLWDRARRLDPTNEHVLGNLALAHHHAGSAAEAEVLFEQAVLVAPDSYTTWANQAVWLQDLGKHVAAMEACTRALALRPASPLMLNNRGVSRMAIGDRSGARRDFEESLEHDPDAELAIYIRANLARLARGNARVDEAARMLRRGAEFVCDGKLREAIPLLLEALDLYGEAWHAWLMLGLAYREERQWDKCFEAMAQVVELNPDHAWARSELAMAALALGRTEEAWDQARQAVDAESDDPGLLCNLGLVELERGRLEAASDAFEQAHEMDPADEVIALCRKELKKRRRKDPRWGDRGWAL
ncbi:MAG: tetratricopeptide repeat protein [Proteobacteria bacterium]|nr:tetratricopeptide repeat protein [Pseudomonadota bacterium]